MSFRHDPATGEDYKRPDDPFGFNGGRSSHEVIAPGAFKNCDTVFYSPSTIRAAMESIGYPDYLIDRVIGKLEGV